MTTFFFVRNTDPHYHLRIRYFVNNKVKDGFNKVILQVIEKADFLKRDGLLWKIELDTYNRELKRYGHSMINIIEQIFHIDSLCFLKLDSEIKFMENEKDRMLYACANVDSWFKIFQLDLLEKIAFTEKSKFHLSTEFINSIDTKKINLFYRKFNEDFHLILGNTIIKQFSQRHKDIQNLIKVQGQSSRDLHKILLDIIHMSLNRFFLSDQRTQEYLIYELICKYYKSQKNSNRIGIL